MSESIWNDPRITAYVLDELSSQDRAALEDEMQSNPELVAAVDEAKLVTGKLEGLFAAESTPPLDAERRQQILSADSTHVLPMTGSTASEKSRRSWRAPLAAFAAAATLLLLVGLAPWLRDETTVPSLSQAPERDMPAVEVADESKEDGNGLSTGAAENVDQQNTWVVVEGTDKSGDDTIVVLDQVDLNDNPSDSLAKSSPQARGRVLPAAPSRSFGRQDGTPGENRQPMKTTSEESRDKLSTNVDRFNLQRLQVEAVDDGIASRAVRGGDAEEREFEQLDRNEKPIVMESTRPFFSEQQGSRDAGAAMRQSQDAQPAPKQANKVVALGGSAELAESDAIDAFGTEPGQMKESSADVTRLRSRLDSEQAAEKFLGVKEENGARPLASSRMAAESPVPVTGTAIGKPPIANSIGNRAVALDAPAPAADPDPVASRGLNLLQKGRALGVDRFARGQIGGGGLGGFGNMPAADADFSLPIDEGRGPGIAGDRFEPITDNPFKRVSEHETSTFSVDVDTASYSKVRDVLMRANQLPRPDAVRIEELVNYFDYDYEPPAADAEHPFAARVSVTSCPWNEEHRLARIALKGKTMGKEERPRCNLVFLLDTSGSMNAANKLPLVQQGMKLLLGELNDDDKVAIVVYAGSAGMVLDSTSAGKKNKIHNALTRLSAGGSTNGGAGIALAYQTARSNFITDGVNRVILCTDGDFNVGATGTDELVQMVEKEAKGGVFLSVLGFGMGNHNDAMLERISGRGNGNYAFIDNENEAKKVLVDQTNGTLVTIAKDVKLQIEFNPQEVSAYRLIGYENRILEKEDFNDDKKDAGEIGAGHAVTALYEIVPAGVEADAIRPKADDLVFQTSGELTQLAHTGLMMMLKLRYKQPDEDESTLVKIPVTDDGDDFESADDDVRFAAAVAGFGMQLRRSQYVGTWTLSDALRVARASRGDDRYELRAEFIEIVRRASEIMGEE